jgi:hypothetical protein
MKKTILIGAIMMMTGISFSFATKTDNISGSVTHSFRKDFTNAKDVKWESGKIFVKATFKMDDQVTYAYYSKDGELIATTRNILSSQLPIAQLVGLRKSYGAYWITDLFEVNSNNETSYYITLENADYKMVLKSNTGGDWETYSKEEKISQ